MASPGEYQNNNLSPEEKTILTRMLRVAGVRLEDVDTSEPGWFNQFEWSPVQQKKFIAWLSRHLFENDKVAKTFTNVPFKALAKRGGKKKAQEVAIEFVEKYGWHVKKEKKVNDNE